MYKLLDEFIEQNNISCTVNEPMSSHTSFRIGGPADRFVVLKTIKELTELIAYLSAEKIPYFVLGRGSDLLVSDEGYRGVMISLEGEFKEITLIAETDTEVKIRCGAGASLAALCAFARDNSLSGLEFAWGIPGSVGGACYMNAGAYGGEMKDVLLSAEHISADGSRGSLAGEEMELSYRHSAYTGTDNIIVFADIKLKKGNQSEIIAKMDELMGKRKEKQPLEYPSAGSTFKRPEGYFAAALIEECGLKGVHVGDACVSEKHSGFVVNKGSASCADVLELIEIVRKAVKEKKNVDLELEVICL